MYEDISKKLTIFNTFSIIYVVDGGWVVLILYQENFKKYFGFCININNNFCVYMKNCLWVLVLILIFLCKSQLYSLWFLWAGQFC